MEPSSQGGGGGIGETTSSSQPHSGSQSIDPSESSAGSEHPSGSNEQLPYSTYSTPPPASQFTSHSSNTTRSNIDPSHPTTPNTTTTTSTSTSNTTSNTTTTSTSGLNTSNNSSSSSSSSGGKKSSGLNLKSSSGNNNNNTSSRRFIHPSHLHLSNPSSLPPGSPSMSFLNPSLSRPTSSAIGSGSGSSSSNAFISTTASATSTTAGNASSGFFNANGSTPPTPSLLAHATFNSFNASAMTSGTLQPRVIPTPPTPGPVSVRPMPTTTTTTTTNDLLLTSDNNTTVETDDWVQVSIQPSQQQQHNPFNHSDDPVHRAAQTGPGGESASKSTFGASLQAEVTTGNNPGNSLQGRRGSGNLNPSGNAGDGVYGRTSGLLGLPPSRTLMKAHPHLRGGGGTVGALTPRADFDPVVNNAPSTLSMRSSASSNSNATPRDALGFQPITTPGSGGQGRRTSFSSAASSPSYSSLRAPLIGGSISASSSPSATTRSMARPTTTTTTTTTTVLDESVFVLSSNRKRSGLTRFCRRPSSLLCGITSCNVLCGSLLALVLLMAAIVGLTWVTWTLRCANPSFVRVDRFSIPMEDVHDIMIENHSGLVKVNRTALGDREHPDSLFHAEGNVTVEIIHRSLTVGGLGDLKSDVNVESGLLSISATTDTTYAFVCPRSELFVSFPWTSGDDDDYVVSPANPVLHPSSDMTLHVIGEGHVDVEVTVLNGLSLTAVEVTSAMGDLVVNQVRSAKVALSTAAGNIEVTDVASPIVHLNTGEGDVSGHRVDLYSKNSTSPAVVGELRVSVDKGSVGLSGIKRGTSHLSIGEGDSTIAVNPRYFQGTFDLSTVHGGVTVRGTDYSLMEQSPNHARGSVVTSRPSVPFLPYEFIVDTSSSGDIVFTVTRQL